MTSSFYFKPGEGERVETEITLSNDSRSCLYGVVRDPSGQAVESALVMLFEANGERAAHCAYTDENGQFMFGPLKSGVLYHCRISKNTIKIRDLEIVTD